MYELPEGMMFNPYPESLKGSIVKQSTVQSLCKVFLNHRTPYDFDPSYDWAKEVKDKRGKK